MTDRRAHAEQDEELCEALATVASEATRLGRTLTRTEWPEPLRDVVEQGDVPVERAIAEKMISAVARELSDGWEVNFGLLHRFWEKKGDCEVPQGYETESGEKLGHWVGAQRKLRKKGLLLTSRERRLDKLWFTWDAIDAKFERNFELLLALVAREGHADVPKRHVVEDGEKL